MKNFWFQLLSLFLLFPDLRAQGVQCDLVFELAWEGEAYLLGEQQGDLRVTRCDYLLSQFALQRANGSWTEATKDLTALVGHGKSRSEFSLGRIPKGDYRAIRFVVGLDAATNRSDPNQFPPEHPLNPQFNNLHWTWQTGYIFCALEGYSCDDLGFLYHLGNEDNAVAVAVPLNLSAAGPRTVSLELDLGKILQHGGWEIREKTSTHSRAGDPIARLMRQALATAFTAKEVRKGVFHSGGEISGRASTVPGNAQPQIQKHFPRPYFPADNPLTHEGVALGKRLFFDPLLSQARNLSCASCHQPEAAFSDLGKDFSRGHLGGRSERNTMPLFNLVWHGEMFWDGRATTLREQVLHPIEHPDELALPLAEAVARLSGEVSYQRDFAVAFSNEGVSADLLAKALEQYLLSLVSQEARFDQAMRGEVEFTSEEKRGFELFVTEYDPANGLRGADCFHCHGGALFSNHTFANNGLRSEFRDLGRETVTGKTSDRGKFKVPSLRNLAATAPYMHDGRFSSLAEVIDHYDSGVQRSATLDPNLAKHPVVGLELTDSDKAALLTFLNTLNDTQFIAPQ